MGNFIFPHEEPEREGGNTMEVEKKEFRDLSVDEVVALFEFLEEDKKSESFVRENNISGKWFENIDSPRYLKDHH